MLTERDRRQAPGPSDLPEDLFPEARQRRRRRRLAAGSVVALAAALGLGIFLAAGGPAGLWGHHATPGGSPGAGSPPIPPGLARAAALSGMYDISAPAFPTATNGLLTLGGESSLAGHPSDYWFERTADGGRRWVAGPVTNLRGLPAANRTVVFVSDSQGWTYGGPLYATDNGGATWRLQLQGPYHGPVAVLGHSAWFAVHVRSGNRYWTEIDATPRPGAPLTPLPARLPGTFTALLRATATTAWAFSNWPTGTSPTGGHLRLEATTDGGRHWSGRTVPCPADTVTMDTQVAAAGPRSLWIACPSASETLAVIYQSADGGRTWARMTPREANQPTGLQDFLTLQAVSPSVAWAVDTAPPGGTSIMRTADGGRSWTTAFAVAGGACGPTAVRGCGTQWLTGWSSQDAWLSGFIAGPRATSHPEVFRTTDAGRTWQVALLPIPAGVPTAR